MSYSKRFRTALVVAGLTICATGGAIAAELDGPVSIVYDQFRVPTIVATTEHDAIYMQGYMHAKDRFFQMDTQRRAFAGTLSELVGPAGLPQDVQLRTLGIGRAAERSLPVQTPEVMAWLEAYSDGVNAWLTDTSNPLPIEYGPLEIDRNGIPLWTPLDSMLTAKGLAFQLSFDWVPFSDSTGCSSSTTISTGPRRSSPSSRFLRTHRRPWMTPRYRTTKSFRRTCPIPISAA
jgi:penicillin amidase